VSEGWSDEAKKWKAESEGFSSVQAASKQLCLLSLVQSTPTEESLANDCLDWLAGCLLG
jgi:hypothetical protein